MAISSIGGNYRKKFGIGAICASMIKYIILFFFVIISLGPVLWVLIGSFKTHKELFSGSSFALPAHFSLTNYIDALSIAPIAKFFSNSLIVGIANTLLSVFLISCCAYVVARFDFKMKNVIILLISSVLLIPAQSISQPIFAMFKTFNLFDTKTGLVFVYLAFSIPVTFYIMRSYFLSIPRSLEESAYIDGAGFLRTYIQIIMPLAKPGMATAAILQFLSSWNEFFFALMLTSGSNARTVPIALNYFTSQFSSNYPAMFAAIMLTIIPTIIMFIFAQEQVVDSLTAGAVKG